MASTSAVLLSTQPHVLYKDIPYKVNTFSSMCVLPFVESSVKKAFHWHSLPYLYISRGRLAAPDCVEAVLLNGGLVAN